MIFLSSLRVCFVAPFLLICALSQAQSDSVTGGKNRGSSRVRVGSGMDPGNTTPVSKIEFVNLLAGVRMESTGGRFHRTTVNFGPFINNSGVPLTITLNHVGGSDHRHATGFVDGVEIAHGNGGATMFIVPPFSKYHWHVKNEHSITASVPTTTLEVGKVGLPSAGDFAAPARIGVYRGCLNVYDEYDTTGDRGGDPYRIVAVEYYFAESPMSDSSDGWGPLLVTPEFGVVVAGPPPLAPGSCVNPRERPPSDTGGS